MFSAILLLQNPSVIILLRLPRFSVETVKTVQIFDFVFHTHDLSRGYEKTHERNESF